MDDITKIIIATLSGFIIAFFAEPVKSYFQNRTKLKHLRIALYKEMGYNNVCLNVNLPRSKLRQTLKNECYEHAIKNEITLFYQLSEADEINLIQGLTLPMLLDESADDASHALGRETYLGVYAGSFYSGTFDQKILRKLSPGGYKKTLERGRKYSAGEDEIAKE